VEDLKFFENFIVREMEVWELVKGVYSSATFMHWIRDLSTGRANLICWFDLL
jgi:hypothetical protein